jgi:hypothetical protein
LCGTGAAPCTAGLPWATVLCSCMRIPGWCVPWWQLSGHPPRWLMECSFEAMYHVQHGPGLGGVGSETAVCGVWVCTITVPAAVGGACLLYAAWLCVWPCCCITLCTIASGGLLGLAALITNSDCVMMAGCCAMHSHVRSKVQQSSFCVYDRSCTRHWVVNSHGLRQVAAAYYGLQLDCSLPSSACVG